MKQKIVVYKAVPADVADYLREHAEVVTVDADAPAHQPHQPPRDGRWPPR